LCYINFIIIINNNNILIQYFN